MIALYNACHVGKADSWTESDPSFLFCMNSKIAYSSSNHSRFKQDLKGKQQIKKGNEATFWAQLFLSYKSCTVVIDGILRHFTTT